MFLPSNQVLCRSSLSPSQSLSQASYVSLKICWLNPFLFIDRDTIFLVLQINLSILPPSSLHYFLKQGRAAWPGFLISQICGFYSTAQREREVVKQKGRKETKEENGKEHSERAREISLHRAIVCACIWMRSTAGVCVCVCVCVCAYIRYVCLTSQ